MYEQDIFAIYHLISLNKRLLKRYKLRYNKIVRKRESTGKHTPNRISSCDTCRNKPISCETPINNNRYSQLTFNHKNSGHSEYILSYDILIKHINSLERLIDDVVVDGQEESAFMEERVRIKGPRKRRSFFNRVNILITRCFARLLGFSRGLMTELSSRKLRGRFRRMTNDDENSVVKFKCYDRVSRIDRYSRVLYPIVFVVFNAVYWKYYLNQREKIDHFRFADQL